VDVQALTLEILPGAYAVCRLAPDAAVPGWAGSSVDFVATTRTRAELSVVCAEGLVPAGTKAEAGMRILKVAGTLDFSLTGILASLAVPLAQAKVSLFAVSTYDTDYVLVPAAKLEEALGALRAAGHHVQEE
jgi:hypothetical protein